MRSPTRRACESFRQVWRAKENKVFYVDDYNEENVFKKVVAKLQAVKSGMTLEDLAEELNYNLFILKEQMGVRIQDFRA